MSGLGFKSIQPVPPFEDFLDIVLSKTQRKTPTVVHKGYAVTRIRAFYMRKVKFTQQTFDEKLGAILEEFPRLESIHPFYADLMNVLYDKDHYKLALAQTNTARHLIDTVAKDYLKLLKYGDSLFRCKQLKRAALGRMATIMRRQKETLLYLEEVRQHLSRLPCIDPNTRTLLICGYPNVGKSSFMNKLTRANVDVQPYAFTTKSLFVGHMDYKYLRWQVIDTPGLLDHPLEERNTIEMQSVTAMAHIRACVLFFVDMSETCGYSIEQQVSLFHNIKPLFVNRPILVVLNKIDLVRLENIGEQDRQLLQTLLDQGLEFSQSSCVTDEGIMQTRNTACDKLLSMRVDSKMKGQKINDILNRLHLAQPAPRDDRPREPFIPEAVQKHRAIERKLERDIEGEEGGAGVYNIDLKKSYILSNPDWNHDDMPEIINGKNIADFVDPDIAEKLLRLEAEEERFEYSENIILTEEQKEIRQLAKRIKERKQLLIVENRIKRNNNRRPVLVSRIVKRRKPSKMQIDAQMKEDSDSPVIHQKDRSALGLRDKSQKQFAEKIKRISQKKLNQLAKRGEADREVQASKPKHLYSGKRKLGSADRR